MATNFDVDIDLPDRTVALAILKHIPASIKQSDGKFIKHNTGIHVTNIPVNPIAGFAAIDHKSAEERSYVKLDLLNVNLYQHVTSEAHLNHLMNTLPPWKKLHEKEFCTKLTHIGNHYQSLMLMPEPVDSITRLAMFLAIIRPGKKHLIGQKWSDIAETVWDRDVAGYTFRKSHSIAYSYLVVVHMNLICEAVS